MSKPTREDIIAIKTDVVTCARCGAWLGRAPLYYGTGDKGDSCHKCGSTSIRVRTSRPFGPKSRDWHLWLNETIELIKCFDEDELAYAEVLSCVVLKQGRPLS